MGKELQQQSKDCVPTNHYTLLSLTGLLAMYTGVRVLKGCCVGNEQVNHKQQTSVHLEQH